MSLREISFPSANGRDTVRAWAYTPLGTPRGVIQLMHGYGEHSRRYLHMISAFNQAGFAVYADDHIGSMLARGYAALYGQDIRALMLCGVCSQLAGCERLYDDADFRAEYERDRYQPGGAWFGRVLAGANDRIENPINASAWVATDPRVVIDHGQDMFNTFDTTLELVWDYVQLYHFIENDDWARSVPRNIPAYLIAGDQDPCGNYGEGLYHCANLLARSGHRVSVHAYPGYRHEIHNELDLRDEVEAGLIRFIDGVLG